MSKIVLIGKHQFRQEVSKRSFLLILFMMPLFIVFAVGFGYLIATLQDDSTTLGYVDEAGLIANPLANPEEDIQFVALETRAKARVALETGQVDAYYVLSDNFAGNRQAQFYYNEEPSYGAMRYFEDQVRLNLLSGQSPQLVERAIYGADVTIISSDNNREFGSGGPEVGYFVPVLAAVIFAFLVLTTSGYMLTVVVEEKQNRTMEIVVTSVSPNQMMIGKVGGAIAIAILQFTVWTLFIIGAIWLGINVLELDWLQNLNIDWLNLMKFVIVALPAYLFIAAIATLIGSAMVDDQEAQQVGPFFFLIMFMPVYLIMPIAANPNGPIALAFSFFPMTSITTLAMRNLFIEIPAWQIAVSAAIGLVCAIAAIWLAGKAFRMSMLRYGQRLKLRDLFPGKSSKELKATTAEPGYAGGGQ